MGFAVESARSPIGAIVLGLKVGRLSRDGDGVGVWGDCVVGKKVGDEGNAGATSEPSSDGELVVWF